MYSWSDDLSDWARPGNYKYQPSTRAAREADSARSAAAGPRTYVRRQAPDMRYVDPTKRVRSTSRNPMIVAVDVTASMATWPAEIFDRLPLFYNTLSQYRPDLEVSFVAVGDALAFEYPLQTSGFCRGFDLEASLKAIYPEGLDRSSIDPPESYGLLALWANTHVEVPEAERPFLIVFGDITMHAAHSPGEVRRILGDEVQAPVDCLAAWQVATRTWDAWFLRSPRCWHPEQTDAQWSEAIGTDRVVRIQDEARAVDLAMALVARAWGRLDDFLQNMRARQDDSVVAALAAQLAGPGR